MTYPTQADVEATGDWFQQVTFPNGLTVGRHPAVPMIHELIGRFDPSGLSFLDIGCNCGVMCAEMELAGADHVYGIDLSTRHIAQQELTKRAFDLKHTSFGLTSVYDLSPKMVFDLVSFCGVYYHLWHPMLGLQKAWASCRKAMLVEGAIALGDTPMMEFCLGVSETAPHDPTNWWYPTELCMTQMIQALGGVKGIECIERDYDGPLRRMWLVERDETVPMSETGERSC